MCVCSRMCGQVNTYHSIHVEVRGQLKCISSPFTCSRWFSCSSLPTQDYLDHKLPGILMSPPPIPLKECLGLHMCKNGVHLHLGFLGSELK